MKSEKTDETVLSEAVAFFRSMDKKTVVLKKESDGYIGSHLMVALLRESVSMIRNGICDMQDIDDAFTYGPGLRYALFGIFTTYQLAGGDGGVRGLLCGPIGQSSEKWLPGYCNWTSWPEEAKEFFRGTQETMDRMLAERDERHGRNIAELARFRDEGLVRLLQIHGLI